MRSVRLVLGALVLGATLAGVPIPTAGADPAQAPAAPSQAPAAPSQAPAAPSQAPAAPSQPPAAPLTVTRPSDDLIARRLARRAARTDRDIQTLRAGLVLTPAQDALWPPVADAIRGVDAARGFRFRQLLANAPSQVDGLKLQGAHMAAMGAAIGRLADATKPFVATLTPDQRSRLPGLLQGVRLPKVMSRALDVSQDTGGASWGIGGQSGAGGAAPGDGRTLDGGPNARAPGGPGAGGMAPGSDDEE